MQLNFLPNPKTPLSYPGGKRKLIPYLQDVMPKGLDEMVCPFMGGGSVECYFAAQGKKVYGYDIFEPLIHFWQTFLNCPNDVIKSVLRQYPIKEKSVKLRRIYESIECDIERSAAFWIVNKTSFSSLGFISKKGTRNFEPTKSRFTDFYNYFNPNLKVYSGDYVQTLEKYNGVFAYLDPPYIGKENLYQDGNSMSFPHENLCEILKNRKSPWILSYGDHPKVYELYSGFSINKIQCHYYLRNKYNKFELLITNY